MTPSSTESVIHAVRHCSVVILATVSAPWPAGCLLVDSGWVLRKPSSCGRLRLSRTSRQCPLPRRSSQQRLVTISLGSCFGVLRQIRCIRRSLPRKALSTLVTSFITSKMDNCNAPLAGLPQRDLDRIQSMLNATARLTADARKFDHVTPLLVNLHWLRVTERIQYKLCVLVHRCLNGAAPQYLFELIQSRLTPSTTFFIHG